MTLSCFAMLHYCSATLVLPVDVGPEGTTSVPTPAAEPSVGLSSQYVLLVIVLFNIMATLLEAIPGC